MLTLSITCVLFVSIIIYCHMKYITHHFLYHLLSPWSHLNMTENLKCFIRYTILFKVSENQNDMAEYTAMKNTHFEKASPTKTMTCGFQISTHQDHYQCSRVCIVPSFSFCDLWEAGVLMEFSICIEGDLMIDQM